MDESNIPTSSHDDDSRQIQQPLMENDTREIPTLTTPSLSNSSPAAPKSFSLASTVEEPEQENRSMQISLPLIIRPSIQSPLVCQRSNMRSSMSLMLLPNQPPTLFYQALSKLNESSVSIAGLTHLRNSTFMNHNETGQLKSGDITPPDSLTSAPPSYSFVLRQMAARRRPRLMGTFIPSPSYIQHPPPPTYATAFDIYVDNPVPPVPPRVCHFGFASMPAVCPDCGSTGMTIVTSKITLCTHMCALILCVFCCWLCAPLPYILRSCKDVYHYCRNCRTFLGMYCPTNPENNLA